MSDTKPLSLENHDQLELYMLRALSLAKKAATADEVPIGALVVSLSGEVIAEAHNLKELSKKSTSHAEIIAIEKANNVLGRWRLDDCILFTTLEPCTMCSGAIVQARLHGVVYGATDLKAGGHSLFRILSDERLNHQPRLVSGILETKCSDTLKKFFYQKRQATKHLT